jgi:hypothetical protein
MEIPSCFKGLVRVQLPDKLPPEISDCMGKLRNVLRPHIINGYLINWLIN